VILQQFRRCLKPARVKGASLYIVIVIALIIALLCEAMIAAAFYYRTYHALRNRQERLDNNVKSGLNMLLADQGASYYESKSVQLFEDGRDTIRLSKRFWGAFDVGVSEASTGRDSSVTVMLIGNQPDTAKRFAIWLADEDRPLSVSGNTIIRGEVYLPKSGIRTAYVDNHGYEGQPDFIMKKHLTSKRELPEPDVARLTKIDQYFIAGPETWKLRTDTIESSFNGPTHEYHFKEAFTLNTVRLDGNIIIRCDSVLTIDSSARLNDVMVFAPAIVVRPGFHGRCQLFARDSIRIGDRTTFAYPSMIALIRTEAAQVKKQGLIRFGKDCIFSGDLMAWEKVPGVIMPAIELGENGVFRGQIYTALVGIGNKSIVNGSIICRRFLYRSAFSTYENYLIGAHIDAKALSPFYSSAIFFPFNTANLKKIVKWLK
jgi:hypothetical protein